MKKKIIFMFALLLGVGVAFTSCSKEDSKIDGSSPETAEGKQYKVIIPAEKKSTKVVADGGAATFKTTENIYICNTSNGNAIDAGVLHPQSNAAHSNFIGTLTGNYSVGNTLKVLYNTTSNGIADYSSQDGTLGGVVDAGIATVTVSNVSATNGTIQTTTANIENLQSIFKFTFKCNGTTLNVKSVSITSKGNKLQQSYNAVSGTPVYGSVLLSNTTAQSTVYGSLRFTQTANDPITFVVKDENDKLYIGTKNAPASGFVTNKFYTSTVTVEKHAFGYYGTANCLLMANTQSTGTLNVAPYVTDYTFRYTGDSGKDIMPEAVKAELIWEEQVGLISSATVSSDHTTMTVIRAAGQYGNALIGIYDASDNLLWSYHIWCPEDNPTTYEYPVTKSGDTYKVMNMALGATKYATIGSSDADKVAAYGLCYQWGRKDPLGRGDAISSNIIKPVYDKNGSTITLTDATYSKDIRDGIISGYTNEATDGPKSHFMARYTIANPTVFIYADDTDPNYTEWYGRSWILENNPYFWGNPYQISQTSSTFPTMSQTYKSIFDPSPEGYRVALPDTYINFTRSRINAVTQYTAINAVGNENQTWTTWRSTTFPAYKGYEFYYQRIGSGPTEFYHASGCRLGWNGLMGSVGQIGYWWTSSSVDRDSANGIKIEETSVSPLNQAIKMLGGFVRCVKEP